MMATGRTLFGGPPYKGQEFDDHYFGSISGRVLDFMRDLEKAVSYTHLTLPTTPYV